jgi:hypothetical protein
VKRGAASVELREHEGLAPQRGGRRCERGARAQLMGAVLGEREDVGPQAGEGALERVGCSRMAIGDRVAE